MFTPLKPLLCAWMSGALLLAPTLTEAAQTQRKAQPAKHQKAHAKSVKTSSKALARKGRVVREAAIRQGRQGARVTRVASLPTTLDGTPALYSSAALVVNAISGQRIYEKNAQAVVPIASITKLMTAMVALDMHLPLDEEIEISAADIDTLKNSSSRLAVGTRLTRGEVMHLALMASENRAAHALARTAPGGLDAFIKRMNQTAQALGMTNTRFVDPTGLNSQNVSTAEDLVRLVQASHFYPEIKAYSTSQELRFVSNVDGREKVFHNTNPLVKADNWEIGVSKTGYISEAGKCLVMRATIDGTPIIMVLLDSAGKLTRIGDANRIKRWLETDPGARLKAG